jgi:putative flippase GtrA
MAKTKTSTGGQVARFGLVGIMNTLIDYVLFIGITKVFSIPLDRVWVAKLVSGSVAIVNSFFFNKNWVFKKTNSRNVGAQVVKFLATTFVAVYIIQLGLVQLFSSEFPQVGQFFYHIAVALGLTKLLPNLLTEPFVIKTVAFGLGTVASMTWNFVLYKVWAFKE